MVKMAANYEENGRVGKLKVGFQQVLLVQIFVFKFQNIAVKHH